MRGLSALPGMESYSADAKMKRSGSVVVLRFINNFQMKEPYYIFLHENVLTVKYEELILINVLLSIIAVQCNQYTNYRSSN